MSTMSKTDAIVELTKELIKFESTESNPDKIHACKDFIKSYFKDTDVIVKELVSENKPSLIITCKDTKKPKLMLNGHFDVVAGEKEQFYPYVENGKLYGRGALDMKSGVATCMYILKEFADQKPDIGVILTSDEEIGGYHGMRHVIEQGYGGNLLIAAEQNPSEDIHKVNLTTSGKGIMWVKLICEGKACHGSRPWNGVSASEKLVKALAKLETLFPKTWPQDKWKTTYNIGTIKAGESPNKVCDYAESIVDIRITEHETKETILDKLSSLDGVKLEIVTEGSLLYNNPSDDMIQKLKKTAEKVTGNTSELGRIYGASDARFASAKGMASILTGTFGDNMHALNEYVEIESITLFYDIVCAFIKEHVLPEE